ncbi:MAG: SAM-dependent chlorinase/fluorinase [Nitrospirae bacterium]|nr:SAM-dependent chlorinase/fluorinase [Nitrospirota bacterium]MCL5977495.1 SAM-dependent chlorinase/fluorinase [Nitrospirota bacterium]
MKSSAASERKIITLTTDFGYKDPFVGEMKGVILSINPSANIIDITHGIEPYNIEEAAFAAGSSYRYFPDGTVHIAVVDPGVGSERRAIIVEADGHYFVGPDNGIFSYVLARALEVKVINITEEKYMLSKTSATFQGRDVFAPAAAWLSGGIELGKFGSKIDDYRKFEIPAPEVKKDSILGEVIYIDRFGNVITNIRKDDIFRLGEESGEQYYAEIKGKAVRSVRHYSQAVDKSLHCLINSSGHMEIFVNTASASRLFNIKKGDKVTALSPKYSG